MVYGCKQASKQTYTSMCAMWGLLRLAPITYTPPSSVLWCTTVFSYSPVMWMWPKQIRWECSTNCNLPSQPTNTTFFSRGTYSIWCHLLTFCYPYTCRLPYCGNNRVDTGLQKSIQHLDFLHPLTFAHQWMEAVAHKICNFTKPFPMGRSGTETELRHSQCVYLLERAWASPTLAGLHCTTRVYVCLRPYTVNFKCT